MAATVGHELRNPLGVLTNSLYLIRTATSTTADDRLRRQLDTADREIAAATLIVSDLLEFSRPRAANPVLIEVLVTGGPYAHARHPLYAVEMITIAGTTLQFVQPWAALIAVGVLALLVVRSVFEERVLAEAYPEYAAYKAKTARFIPGVI